VCEYAPGARGGSTWPHRAGESPGPGHPARAAGRFAVRGLGAAHGAAGERPWASLLGDSLRVAWGFADWPRPYLGNTPDEVERLIVEARFAALLEWAVLAMAALALLWLRLSGRLKTGAFAVLALMLVTADLFKAGVGINPAIDVDHAAQPVTPALRYLQQRTPNRFVGVHIPSPLGPGSPMPPDVAMRYGLR
jgi:hypothetical protein